MPWSWRKRSVPSNTMFTGFFLHIVYTMFSRREILSSAAAGLPAESPTGAPQVHRRRLQLSQLHRSALVTYLGDFLNFGGSIKKYDDIHVHTLLTSLWGYDAQCTAMLLHSDGPCHCYSPPLNGVVQRRLQTDIDVLTFVPLFFSVHPSPLAFR